MIPKGPIFRKLRERALETIPEGVVVARRSPLYLSDWFNRGAFSILVVGGRKVKIMASPVDLGCGLLTDVECLQNHCFEHLQELARTCDDTILRSDAWFIVTVYYLGFFAAQGLLRLIGEPVVFLDKELVGRLTSLSPGGGKIKPSTHILRKTKVLSVTQAEYELRDSRKKPHEATWKTLLSLFDGLSTGAKSSGDVDEILLYQLLSSKCLFPVYTDYEWPSRVRVHANYRPGFAYTLIDQIGKVNKHRLLMGWEAISTSKMLTLLDSAETACRRDNMAFSCHVQLMHELSLTVFCLFRQLYGEVLARRSIDKRFENARRTFFKRMCKRGADLANVL